MTQRVTDPKQWRAYRIIVQHDDHEHMAALAFAQLLSDGDYFIQLPMDVAWPEDVPPALAEALQQVLGEENFTEKKVTIDKANKTYIIRQLTGDEQVFELIHSTDENTDAQKVAEVAVVQDEDGAMFTLATKRGVFIPHSILEDLTETIKDVASNHAIKRWQIGNFMTDGIYIVERVINPAPYQTGHDFVSRPE